MAPPPATFVGHSEDGSTHTFPTLSVLLGLDHPTLRQRRDIAATEREIGRYVVPLSEMGDTRWKYVGIAFCIWVVGLICALPVEAMDRRHGRYKQLTGPWCVFRPFYYLRRSDTMRQNCTYQPNTDKLQAPGKGNIYRLIAIVGPDICGIKEDKKQGEDKSLGGMRFTLPSVMGYFTMVLIVTFAAIMQLVIPYRLCWNQFASYHIVGVKIAGYYMDNFEQIFLIMLPLSLVGCKFFFSIERMTRDELNQCSYLYRAIYHGEVRYQSLTCVWAYFWVTVSLLLNLWVAVNLSFYVVHSIATFTSRVGGADALMNFILKVIGSVGMMSFDDQLMSHLPLWQHFYQEHTALFHSQGRHWREGEFIDMDIMPADRRKQLTGDHSRQHEGIAREWRAFQSTCSYDSTGHGWNQAPDSEIIEYFGILAKGNTVTDVSLSREAACGGGARNPLNAGDKILKIAVLPPHRPLGVPLLPSGEVDKDNHINEEDWDPPEIPDVGGAPEKKKKNRSGVEKRPKGDHKVVWSSDSKESLSTAFCKLRWGTPEPAKQYRTQWDTKHWAMLVETRTQKTGTDGDHKVHWSLSWAGLDDVLHGILYIVSRFITMGAPIFILAAYYVNGNGQHVGI